MDRLERYLDWVCGRLGGAKEMRAHVRRELQEHLLDAATEHEGAGMSKEEAMQKALDDFGAPGEVRDELEETHGARLSAIVLETALNWKERTMKAKWLWKTWAYIAMVAVLLLELAFICGATIFVVPKFHQYVNELWAPASADGSRAGFAGWAMDFLIGVGWFVDYGWLVVIVAAAAWALFEWRIRSENKPLMRFAAIGTVATGLMIVILMMGMALAITPLLQPIPSAAHSQKAQAAVTGPVLSDPRG